MGQKHLLNSKWTAVAPTDRDKHFLVSRGPKQGQGAGAPPFVELQAILSKRRFHVLRHELNDKARWKPGWT